MLVKKDRGRLSLFVGTGTRQSLIFTARQFFKTGANRCTTGGGRVLAVVGRRRSEGMTGNHTIKQAAAILVVPYCRREGLGKQTNKIHHCD